MNMSVKKGYCPLDCHHIEDAIAINRADSDREEGYMNRTPHAVLFGPICNKKDRVWRMVD
jgi:hypothetical protein